MLGVSAPTQAAPQSVGEGILRYHVRRCVPGSSARRQRRECARLRGLETVFSEHCKAPGRESPSRSGGRIGRPAQSTPLQGKV
jgi:hypothetical protein